MLKTYETPGIYVTGIRIQDGSIYLSRVMKNGDIYVDTTEDTIMNRDLQEKDQVNIDTVVSDVKQKEVVLKLLEEINARGTTVLVVTHDQAIVNTMKKRVIRMQKGIITEDEKESGYIG